MAASGAGRHFHQRVGLGKTRRYKHSRFSLAMASPAEPASTAYIMPADWLSSAEPGSVAAGGQKPHGQREARRKFFIMSSSKFSELMYFLIR